MRILVLSDSHGDSFSLRAAIDRNPEADAVVFLGDGADDWSVVSASVINKNLIAVRGNCDSSFSPYPTRAVEDIGGRLIYCAHGHREHVKYGLETLKKEASDADASIVLFGHTHTPYTSYDNGLYIMNPGSVRQNSCGIAEVTDKGVLCFTKKIINKY